MKPKSILFVAIIFVFFISVACNEQGLSAMVTQRSKIITATASGSNSSKQTVSGYIEMDCINAQIPSAYTSLTCYYISGKRVWGGVLYTGDEINAVSIAVSETATNDEIDKSTRFVTDAAQAGNWNMLDLASALNDVQNLSEGEIGDYGHVTTSYLFADDKSYIFIQFTKD